MTNHLEHKMAMDAIGFAAHLLTMQVDTLSALVKAECEHGAEERDMP